MKTRHKMITAVTLVGMISPTFAETSYFLEGMVGQADQENSLPGFASIEDKSKSRGIRGGFHFSDSLALELGHTRFGAAEDSYIDSYGDTITDRLDTDAYTVGLRGTIPLGRVMSLIGRIGWAAWELDYRVSDSAFPGEDFIDNDEGIDSYYGFGVQFQPEDNFRIAVEYTSLEFRAELGDAGTRQDINNFAVSAGWLFD